MQAPTHLPPQPAPAEERRGRWPLVGAVVAVCLILAAVAAIAVVQLANGNDNRAGGPATRTTQAGQATGPTGGQATANSLRGVTPPGWQEYIDPQYDWRVAVPSTWEPVQDRADRVAFRDPQTGAFARVDRAEKPLSPLIREPQRAEHTYEGRGYDRIKLDAGAFKGVQSVDWEFRYRNNGATIHAADLHLLIDSVDYVVSFQAPEASWSVAEPVMTSVRNSFEAGG
jgi:hypothetical protein